MNIGGLQKTSLIDYPGKICSTVFTIGCNFRCGFCHNPELVNSTAKLIPEDEVLDHMRKRQRILDAVCITGGEPTLQKDLPKFARKVKALDLLVKIDTNGSNPVMLNSMIKKRLVDYVAMDIKAPLEKYSKIANVDVDMKTTQKSINLIRKSGIDYEFRTTVVPGLHNRNDIIKIGKWLKGSKRYYLQKFVPAKLLDKEYETKEPYTTNEMKQLLSGVQEYFDECRIRND